MGNTHMGMSNKLKGYTAVLAMQLFPFSATAIQAIPRLSPPLSWALVTWQTQPTLSELYGPNKQTGCFL